MKKIILIILTTVLFFGCAATTPIDTQKCIKIANTAENNGAKSGNELYKECLDKQHQKNESKKGFWESSADSLLFFVLDIIAS